MLRHAMQYLLKSNVSIGMIGLLFKLPFYIFRKHFRCFKDVYIPVPRRFVDLLKDLALMQKDFIPISVIRVKDITFCSGIVYLRSIVNINNPNVPVSVRRSL